MQRTMYKCLVLLLFAGVISSVSYAVEEKPLTPAEGTIMAGDVLSKVDPSTSSSIQRSKYRDEAKGKPIFGYGTVTDVKLLKVKELIDKDTPVVDKSLAKKKKKRRGEPEVLPEGYEYKNHYIIYMYLGIEKEIRYKYDYNMLIQTSQDASNLRPGQWIFFIGEIERVGVNGLILTRSDYPLIKINNGEFKLRDSPKN